MRDSKFYKSKGECVHVKYGENSDGTLSVDNVMYNKRKEKFSGIQGEAYCEGTDGNCFVKFPWIPRGPYQVLDTDYTTYSVVYTCKDFLFVLKETVWILTRVTNPDSAIVTTARASLTSNAPYYNQDILEYTN